ncbi:carbonic anhydrase 1-like [Chrysoperla carnea]|uniref:carbonic anhydrase 1-like n=1 Tax=Chrysoperla carnea TaxID=189513 RepID=UPI001D06D979|nr:carbonic anhydrase 1-like [Chrysoperla carnea]
MESHHDDTVSGNSQSPIDIPTSIVIEDVNAPIYIDYPSDDIGEVLSNTGHGWHVKCNGRKTEFYGGPLKNKFKLEQFHCHWGPKPGVGSEHTVDGKTYSGELHFVHWNAEKYDTFEVASKEKDGLAVLAVFLDVGCGNSELMKITALLPRIKNASDEIILTDLVGINLEKFLPCGRNYWTYSGSLTTPPYSETVTWIILEQPITISEQQLNVFRSLKLGSDHHDVADSKSNHDSTSTLANGCVRNGKEETKKEDSISLQRSKRETSDNNNAKDEKHTHIIENYRVIQPLNDRVIRKYSTTPSKIIENH